MRTACTKYSSLEQTDRHHKEDRVLSRTPLIAAYGSPDRPKLQLSAETPRLRRTCIFISVAIRSTHMCIYSSAILRNNHRAGTGQHNVRTAIYTAIPRLEMSVATRWLCVFPRVVDNRPTRAIHCVLLLNRGCWMSDVDVDVDHDQPTSWLHAISLLPPAATLRYTTYLP